MATTAFSFSSLRPVCAGARSKPRGNPRRKTPSKKPNSNSITTTSSSNSQPSVLPTTYTRLPLMDDDISSDSFPMEITIDEFSALGKKPKKKGPPAKKYPSKKSMNASRFVQEILDEEEEEDINTEEDEIFLHPGFDMETETNITQFGKELEDEDEEEGEIEDGKDKGVPAVMRCFDTAKIYAKAGDGGNGVVAFRREKFVPYGGPSGGDGGQGGHIYLEVDPSMNSLLPFRKTLHFRAGRGRHGQGSKQAGARGEDVVVLVPQGTVVREATKGKVGEGEVLMELLRPGQRALLLPGGRGGRGNASFRSGNNKIPKIAERGEEGAEMWLDLELKLVADVGIVGAPNAGKSTFLSAITAAEPEIANYPFTTLLPNLGVVSLDFDVTMVLADLPGLLEGAHRGYGLGHEFLRHSERCSVLVHVVDGSAEQPEYEFDAVRLELELFSPALAEKPYIVLFNKMDLPEAFEKWESFRENLQSRGFKPYCISALNKQGTYEIACTAYELLQKERREKKEIEEWQNPQDLNHVADAIKRERSALMSDFEIIHENNSNKWHVVGAGIQRFVQMTNWRYSESLRRFQHALEACGVYKALTKKGVKEGDIVIVGEMEMIWHDEYEKGSSARSSKRDEGVIKAKSSKRDEGTIRWPEFG